MSSVGFWREDPSNVESTKDGNIQQAEGHRDSHGHCRTGLGLSRRRARPTLASVARLMNRASSLLRIGDLDERISIENQATLMLAKKLNLVG